MNILHDFETLLNLVGDKLTAAQEDYFKSKLSEYKDNSNINPKPSDNDQ